jgi:hypothetical protein
MTDSNKEPVNNNLAPTKKERGGVWLPTSLASIGFAIILYGIFAGSPGLFQGKTDIAFEDRLQELWRELVRLVVFSLLLLAAVKINAWRLRRSFGNLLITSLRCLAIVSLIEAMRVVQLDQGVVRILLLSTSKFILCCISMVAFFGITIRESVVFTTGCTIGALLLWLGAHIGMWIM